MTDPLDREFPAQVELGKTGLDGIGVLTGLSQSEVAETLRSFGSHPRETVEQFFS